MLGRKSYTTKEFADAQAAIGDQVTAYQALVKANAGAGTNKKVGAALAKFEPLFFNTLLLALDRRFVHRIRAVAGKDANALNEVEMLCASLMDDDGILTKSTVLKLDPEQSVTTIQFGERIELTADQFDRLSTAFFAEIKARFV